jgi:hypothetical protein
MQKIQDILVQLRATQLVEVKCPPNYGDAIEFRSEETKLYWFGFWKMRVYPSDNWFRIVRDNEIIYENTLEHFFIPSFFPRTN